MRGFLDPAAIDFSFSSRGMNGWPEPVCVVCYWPLSTSLTHILQILLRMLCRVALVTWPRQPSSCGSASQTGREEASWDLFLATVLPQVSFFTHTHTHTHLYSFCLLISFPFLFFFSFFFCFSFLFSRLLHTYTRSPLQCQVSCLADQPTPS